MRPDLTAVQAELAAARTERLDVLIWCELLVEQRAADGDAEATELAALAVASRKRNALAILEAQLAL